MSVPEPLTIIRRLTSLPHRGTGTPQEKQAADIIETILKSSGASVERQQFKTSKTYIREVLILTVLIATGLISADWFPVFSIGLLVFCAVSALLYFDWRPSPLSFLSPSVTSENIIGRLEKPEKHEKNDDLLQKNKQLVLMAHYDSAPVSLLYLPSLVKNFRSSLLMNLCLICLAPVILLVEFYAVEHPVVTWIRLLLAGYFLVQGVITSFDYVRYGYTNGAGDNATGVAAAMTTAMRLWEKPEAGLEVAVVLTGAEETGMTGSKAYLKHYQQDLIPEKTLVLNFDSIGAGDLKIITETGSLSRVLYNNRLVEAAKETARTDLRFRSVTASTWHTGDFDTVWFARAGIPSLTLTAQDSAGAIPYLHRPEDVFETIDEALPGFTADFAEAVIRRLCRGN